ncbi:MAG: HmuY family protein [Prevotella sp.]|nr:HmuY family protein [Prevotella sp.]
MNSKLFAPLLAGYCLLLLTVSCEGVMGGLYDDADNNDNNTAATAGTLYMDATDWSQWYYVDFDSLAMIAESGDDAALQKAQTTFTAYAIPDSTTTERTAPDSLHQPGIYTYWFDVFDKGLSNNKFSSFRPTVKQPEPAHWTIAIHRDNVRTNGGAAYKTNLTDFDHLPSTATALLDSLAQAGNAIAWTADEWSEHDVWYDRSRMLSEYIGSQGIAVNPVLSSWLSFHIPPIPPSATSDNHIFLLRTKDGKYITLQLVNYMNIQGTKCWMTIRYKTYEK